MKKFTVEAHTIVLGNEGQKTKSLVGTREIDQPETLAEASKVYGEADVLARFWDAKVIQVQRELRSGTDTEAKKQARAAVAVVAKARANKAAGDPTLYNMAVELGLITSDEG